METIDFVVSFAPFERQLLADVAASESLELLADSSQEVDDIISMLFDRWGPNRWVLSALAEMEDDLESLNGSPSQEDIRRLYQYFLNHLRSSIVRDCNHRADIAKSDNPHFLEQLLQAHDIPGLLARVDTTINRERDLRSWRILAAMWVTSPPEMSCWTYRISAPLYEPHFDVWRVVRIFRNNRYRPERTSMLLAFCRQHQDRHFEGLIVGRYNAKCRKMVEEHSDKIVKLIVGSVEKVAETHKGADQRVSTVVAGV